MINSIFNIIRTFSYPLYSKIHPYIYISIIHGIFSSPKELSHAYIFFHCLIIIQLFSVIAGISILSEVYSKLMKISLIRAAKTLKENKNNSDVIINSVFPISKNMIMRRIQNSKCEL
jgi:hypothetical protein